MRLSKLKAEDLEAIYSEMRKAGKSETTVTQMHRILSRALKVAQIRGHVGVNVAENLDAPQPAHFEPGLLRLDDAKRLIRIVGKTPSAAHWTIALALGLRQGEVLGMGWDQIDLKSSMLHVTRTLYRMPWKHGSVPAGDAVTCGRAQFFCPDRHSGGLYIGEPKSRAGRRTVPLPRELTLVLREHQRREAARRSESGEQWVGFTPENGPRVELVFTNSTGGARNGQDDWQEWKSLLASASIPSVRLHDARHTAATMLLALKVPSRVVMEMMGWSSTAMTKKYQHVLDGMMREASDLVSAALWGELADETDAPEGGNVISLASRRKAKNHHRPPNRPPNQVKNERTAWSEACNVLLTRLFFGTPGGTRTHTEQILSLLPLPIGLLGRSVNPSRLRQRLQHRNRPPATLAPD